MLRTITAKKVQITHNLAVFEYNLAVNGIFLNRNTKQAHLCYKSRYKQQVVLYNSCIILYYQSMIDRLLLKDLKKWHTKNDRKPLIIRGARQVGKTTIVKIFANNFKQHIFLDLEKRKDRELFEQDLPFEKLLAALFFINKCDPKEKSTIIFIDEIQNSPKAVATLRYFYEEAPDIPVIAAGSLLEVYLEKQKISFPVGRVETLYLYPLTFEEYLSSVDHPSALNAFKQIPVPDYAYDTLFDYFHEYALIGGMPEIVSHYQKYHDLNDVSALYENLLLSYTDDSAKYARNNTMYQVIRHAIETAPLEAGHRIRFQGFGKSSYRSREMGEALRTLERAMLLYLVYPTTNTELPILPDLKKSPRLQFVDTGFINYFSGIQNDYIGLNDLNSIYRGTITEHIIGQEILAANRSIKNNPVFWVREKEGSSAEIDYILKHKSTLVPVEVKSGKTGTMKSLHFFIDNSKYNLSIRLFRNKVSISNIQTPKGKHFKLLNLPYFLGGKLNEYLRDIDNL